MCSRGCLSLALVHTHRQAFKDWSSLCKRMGAGLWCNAPHTYCLSLPQAGPLLMVLCLLVVGQVAWPLELSTAAPLRALHTSLMILPFIPALPGRLLPLLKLDACGSRAAIVCVWASFLPEKSNTDTQYILAGIQQQLCPSGAARQAAADPQA